MVGISYTASRAPGPVTGFFLQLHYRDCFEKSTLAGSTEGTTFLTVLESSEVPRVSQSTRQCSPQPAKMLPHTEHRSHCPRSPGLKPAGRDRQTPAVHQGGPGRRGNRVCQPELIQSHGEEDVDHGGVTLCQPGLDLLSRQVQGLGLEERSCLLASLVCLEKAWVPMGAQLSQPTGATGDGAPASPFLPSGPRGCRRPRRLPGPACSPETM